MTALPNLQTPRPPQLTASIDHGLAALPHQTSQSDWQPLTGDALWRHQLARASQVFVGRAVDVDPAYVLRAVRLFARDVPVPVTPEQADLLRKELTQCALRLTLRVHSEFHRTIDAAHCASTPIDAISVLLRDNGPGDIRMAFRRWGHAFLEEFARTHAWPAAVHAAVILRKQRRRWFRTDGLCRRLGVAKTTLTDSFRKLYGVSLSEYHRRAKIGWAVGELVASNVCVESVALRAAYRSPGSFHEAFRSVTGSSPTEVRRLSRDAVRNLVEGPLSLRMASRVHR